MLPENSISLIFLQGSKGFSLLFRKLYATAVGGAFTASRNVPL